eukprot:2027845-Rhodomonas_salina.1
MKVKATRTATHTSPTHRSTTCRNGAEPTLCRERAAASGSESEFDADARVFSCASHDVLADVVAADRRDRLRVRQRVLGH